MSLPQNTVDKNNSTRRGMQRHLSFKTSFSVWASSLIKSLLWNWIKMHSVCEKAAIFLCLLLSFQYVLTVRAPWTKIVLFPPGDGSIPQKPSRSFLSCNAELKLFSPGNSLRDSRTWPYYILSRTHLAFGIKRYRIFYLPYRVVLFFIPADYCIPTH